MNDKGYISGIIQFEGGKFIIETPQHPRAVKYRKLSADTEHGVANKLVAWFEKNAEAIKALGV